jgi:integrase/recombinase XerD
MRGPRRVEVGFGPLMVHAEGFAAELVAQGYAASSVKSRLGLLDHLSGWLDEQELAATGLTTECAERFVAARRASGYKTWVSPHCMALPLEYLRRVGAVPAPCQNQAGPSDDVLAAYRLYLASERALTDHTIRLYSDIARLFVEVQPQGFGLTALTTAQVTAFVRIECTRRNIAAAQYLAVALRSFLRFLHVAGMTPTSLAAAVPPVCDHQPSLPRGLGVEAVEALLAGCDRGRGVGLRDFAILTLMARLGLRAGEVARLGLDDIDWHRGELVIRGKANRHERLPLPVDVGEALVAYLRTDRHHAQGRALFVGARAPFEGLRSSAVCTLVRHACRRAGLQAVGAHRLRHTAATGMLQAGASLAQVAQVLRHRSLGTTAIYAKVDRRQLASLALPWPGAAS